MKKVVISGKSDAVRRNPVARSPYMKRSHAHAKPRKTERASAKRSLRKGAW